MASSVLVGVNPVFGLYASFAGPIAGGLTSSSRLMVVTTTSAASLAAGSALSSMDPADRPGALFLLTLMAGIVMVLAGVFKLGRYTRFVSQSVMTGFLTGVAVNIIFGQLGDLTGSTGQGGYGGRERALRARAPGGLVHAHLGPRAVRVGDRGLDGENEVRFLRRAGCTGRADGRVAHHRHGGCRHGQRRR